MREPQRAAAVTQRRSAVEEMQHLGDGPVPHPEEPAHVRLIPHELARRARSADHVEVVGVGEELQDVAADESPVRLREDDDVAGGLLDTTLERVAVSLPAFLHDPRAGLARLDTCRVA